MLYHGPSGATRNSFKLVIKESGGAVSTGNNGITTGGSRSQKIHGYLMWSSWTILGLVQIITNRYGKACWRYHQLIHSVFGFITVLATISAVAIMLAARGLILINLHTILGFITFICIILLGIGGIVASSTRLGICNMMWKTKCLLRLGLIHKGFGYLMILATQASLFTGFLIYGLTSLEDGVEENLKIYCGLNVFAFFGTLIVFEILHQLFIRKKLVMADMFENHGDVMTREEFEK